MRMKRTCLITKLINEKSKFVKQKKKSRNLNFYIEKVSFLSICASIIGQINIEFDILNFVKQQKSEEQKVPLSMLVKFVST